MPKYLPLKSLAVCTLLSLSACATGYHSDGFLSGGGYDEAQISPNVWRVSFHGNKHTSNEQVMDYSLLRAAELVHSVGYPYFVISGSADSSQNTSFVTPATTVTTASATGFGNVAYGSATTQSYGGYAGISHRPGLTLIVTGLKDKPTQGMSYEAAFLMRSLKAKYDIAE